MKITLNGREYELRINAGAFRLAKDYHDVSVPIGDLVRPSLDLYARLVWIGILGEDPSLKEQDVALWLAREDDDSEIMDAVNIQLTRFAEAMGGKKTGKGKK